MDQDTQAVRADIDRARQDLGQTLDALGDKVSPKHVVRRRADGARPARERLAAYASGAPAPALGFWTTDDLSRR